jgi:hypothetical protein
MKYQDLTHRIIGCPRIQETNPNADNVELM